MQKYTQDGVEATLDKLEGKVDSIQSSIISIEKTLVKNTDSLEQHMKRSDLLEEHIQLLRLEIEPVKKHVYYVNGVVKAIGVLSLIATIVRVIFEIYK